MVGDRRRPVGGDGQEFKWMNLIMATSFYIMDAKVGSLIFFILPEHNEKPLGVQEGSSQICSTSLAVWRKEIEDTGSR